FSPPPTRNPTPPQSFRPAKAQPPPRPILTVPSAPRPISQMVETGVATGQPTFDIPKAPTNVMKKYDDSSDEEEFPPEQPASNVGRGAGPSKLPPTHGGGKLRRAMSDSGSVYGENKARRSSFFGGIASLFRGSKKKDRESDEKEIPNQWEATRTDKVNAARASAPTSRRSNSRAVVEDTSDEEGMPKNVIRVVNDPKKRLINKAASDVGRGSKVPTTSAPPTRAPSFAGGKLEKKTKVRKKAASDMGTVSPSVHPSLLPPPPTSQGPAWVADNRKRRTSFAEQPTTRIHPTPPATVGRSNTVVTVKPNGVSRSNTVNTMNTVRTSTSTGTATKKKKRKPLSEVIVPPPTAEDLSASLPSARLSSYYDSPALPSPPLSPLSPRTTIPSKEQLVEQEPKHKVPKSLGENARRSKRESALYGSNDWVSHPPGTHPAGSPPAPTTAAPPLRAKSKKVAPGRQEDEQIESLMTIVDRDEKAGRTSGVEAPSRKYGAAKATPESAVIARTLSPDYGSTTNLGQRKTVRLDDKPHSMPNNHVSPPSSVRSDSLAPPSKGILVHHSGATGSSTSFNGNGNVDTAWSRRRASDVDSSDEEGSVDGEYKKAKRALAKETKKLEGAFGSKDKGKGKARDVETTTANTPRSTYSPSVGLSPPPPSFAEVAYMEASVEQYLLNVLAAAPEGSNPYMVLTKGVEDLLPGPYSHNFQYQLYALSAAYAIITIFVSLGLAIRVYRGSFWVVKIRNGYILPHWQVGWTGWAVVFYGLAQGYIWENVQFLEGRFPRNLILWRTLVWIPAWIAGWTAMWVLGVSYIINVQAKGVTITSTFVTPMFVNTIGLAVPLLFSGCTIGLGIATSNIWLEGIDLLGTVLSNLAEGAEKYDGTFSLMNLAPMMALAPKALEVSVGMVKWLRISCAVLFVWGFLLLIVSNLLVIDSDVDLTRVLEQGICVVGFFQLRSIRKSLYKTHISARSSSGTVEQLGGVDKISDGILRNSLGSLAITVVAFVLIDITMLGVLVYISVDTTKTLTSTAGLEASLLADLYVFAAFALPVSILLFYRTLYTPPPPHLSNSSKSTKFGQSSQAASQLYLSQRPETPTTPTTPFAPPTRLSLGLSDTTDLTEFSLRSSMDPMELMRMGAKTPDSLNSCGKPRAL
ncbi:hypothetical protein P7C70_g7320, partial [Phenoliferia sp. Uapishka_3]